MASRGIIVIYQAIYGTSPVIGVRSGGGEGLGGGSQRSQKYYRVVVINIPNNFSSFITRFMHITDLTPKRRKSGMALKRL